MKIFVSPIKCQGIKTKLVSWIKDNLGELMYDRWIEPFMGSGVVGFNVRPQNAIFAESNRNAMTEALILNYFPSNKNSILISSEINKQMQFFGTF